MKPPVIPSKKCKKQKNEFTNEVNPYALLNSNFESEFYDRDICMWKYQNIAATKARADVDA